MSILSSSARRLLGALTIAAALLLLAALTTPAAAAQSGSATADGPAATARGYLQAGAAAVLAADPGATLAPWLVPGSRLAKHQTLLASGAARRHLALGHVLDDVRCDVDLRSLDLGPDGTTASVQAHTIVTTTWHATGDSGETEATGLDHDLTLRLTATGWLCYRRPLRRHACPRAARGRRRRRFPGLDGGHDPRARDRRAAPRAAGHRRARARAERRTAAPGAARHLPRGHLLRPRRRRCVR